MGINIITTGYTVQNPSQKFRFAADPINQKHSQKHLQQI